MFTLAELIEWAKSLPKDFKEFNLVAAKDGALDESYSFRVDMPIIGLAVDEDNKEIIFKVNN